MLSQFKSINRDTMEAHSRVLMIIIMYTYITMDIFCTPLTGTLEIVEGNRKKARGILEKVLEKLKRVPESLHGVDNILCNAMFKEIVDDVTSLVIGTGPSQSPKCTGRYYFASMCNLTSDCSQVNGLGPNQVYLRDSGEVDDSNLEGLDLEGYTPAEVYMMIVGNCQVLKPIVLHHMNEVIQKVSSDCKQHCLAEFGVAFKMLSDNEETMVAKYILYDCTLKERVYKRLTDSGSYARIEGHNLVLLSRKVVGPTVVISSMVLMIILALVHFLNLHVLHSWTELGHLTTIYSLFIVVGMYMLSKCVYGGRQYLNEFGTIRVHHNVSGYMKSVKRNYLYARLAANVCKVFVGEKVSGYVRRLVLSALLCPALHEEDLKSLVWEDLIRLDAELQVEVSGRYSCPFNHIRPGAFEIDVPVPLEGMFMSEYDRFELMACSGGVEVTLFGCQRIAKFGCTDAGLIAGRALLHRDVSANGDDLMNSRPWIGFREVTLGGEPGPSLTDGDTVLTSLPIYLRKIKRSVTLGAICGAASEQGMDVEGIIKYFINYSPSLSNVRNGIKKALNVPELATRGALPQRIISKVDIRSTFGTKLGDIYTKDEEGQSNLFKYVLDPVVGAVFPYVDMDTSVKNQEGNFKNTTMRDISRITSYLGKVLPNRQGVTDTEVLVIPETGICHSITFRRVGSHRLSQFHLEPYILGRGGTRIRHGPDKAPPMARNDIKEYLFEVAAGTRSEDTLITVLSNL